MTRQTLASLLATWLPRLILVALAVALPRLLLSESPPATDEGYMAYFAMKAHGLLSASKQLPGDGPLMFYPILVSWIFGLPGEPLVMLRLVDLVVACVAALLLLAIIAREARERWWAPLLIGAPFLVAMNQLDFIQYGFRNSFQAALVPLLAAVLLSQRPSVSTRKWALIGGLVALGVLLRETFLPFAVLGAVAVWHGSGPRSAWRYCVGGVATAVPIVLFGVLLRGDISGLIAAYLGAGSVYSALEQERLPFFLQAAQRALTGSLLPTGMSVVALMLLIGKVLLRRDLHLLRRTAFWLACSVVPLIEPATKIGFPYHFSICLPPLAGLCALAWQSVPWTQVWRKAAAIALLTLLELTLLAPFVAPQLKAVGPALADLPRLIRNGWSADQVENSNYLLAAKLLREAAPENATASISGFMFSIYPLSGLLPPTGNLSNLSARIIQLELDPQRLAQEIAACSPDLILTTTRTEWPGHAELERAVAMTALYEQAGSLPVDPNNHYGTFGGTLYRRIKPGGNACMP